MMVFPGSNERYRASCHGTESKCGPHGQLDGWLAEASVVNDRS